MPKKKSHAVSNKNGAWVAKRSGAEQIPLYFDITRLP